MICKLTTYGADRMEAINRSVKALDHYVIRYGYLMCLYKSGNFTFLIVDRLFYRGVMHNIALLRDVLLEKKFLAGDLTTNYLPETYPEGFTVRHYML